MIRLQVRSALQRLQLLRQPAQRVLLHGQGGLDVTDLSCFCILDKWVSVFTKGSVIKFEKEHFWNLSQTNWTG